jgi:hypothetical protein
MREQMPEDPALDKLKKQIQEAKRVAYPKSVQENKEQNRVGTFLVSLLVWVLASLWIGFLEVLPGVLYPSLY